MTSSSAKTSILGTAGSNVANGNSQGAAIELCDVDAGYDGVPVLTGVSIHVPAGSILALLGPNGAGKTTVVRTLSGLVEPTKGVVVWDGRPITSGTCTRVRLGMAVVTEERQIVPDCTTDANLRLGLGDPDRAYRLFPELVPLRRRRAGLLSGGEQQMLVLGRALASQPRVLVVDELSLGLAPMAVQRLLLAVRGAAREGTGVLLVEQNARRALEVADRAVVLRNGRVVLSISGDAARADPAAVTKAYFGGSL